MGENVSSDEVYHVEMVYLLVVFFAGFFAFVLGFALGFALVFFAAICFTLFLRLYVPVRLRAERAHARTRDQLTGAIIPKYSDYSSLSPPFAAFSPFDIRD
jgi:ABC-type transport system involved in cytochrome bd biosynthesis fused ATPase/permease subunit